MLDFASIKFRDFPQVAKIAKLNENEVIHYIVVVLVFFFFWQLLFPVLCAGAVRSLFTTCSVGDASDACCVLVLKFAL